MSDVNFSWGVDGHGDKHYDCKDCGEYFGKVDPGDIEHQCQQQEPSN